MTDWQEDPRESQARRLHGGFRTGGLSVNAPPPSRGSALLTIIVCWVDGGEPIAGGESACCCCCCCWPMPVRRASMVFRSLASRPSIASMAAHCRPALGSSLAQPMQGISAPSTGTGSITPTSRLRWARHSQGRVQGGGPRSTGALQVGRNSGRQLALQRVLLSTSSSRAPGRQLPPSWTPPERTQWSAHVNSTGCGLHACLHRRTAGPTHPRQRGPPWPAASVADQRPSRQPSAAQRAAGGRPALKHGAADGAAPQLCCRSIRQMAAWAPQSALAARHCAGIISVRVVINKPVKSGLVV